MVRVKREYYLAGARYSLNKDTIKAVFKKYKLAWKGTFEFPRWMNDENVIVAEFLRENGVTTGAKLKFEGDPLGDFCVEFTKLMDGLGAEYDDAEVVPQEVIDQENEVKIEADMVMWDRIHRPNTDIMRRGTIHNGYKPVPEGFINAALNDFKEKREAEIIRLRESYKPKEKKKKKEPKVEDDSQPKEKPKKVKAKKEKPEWESEGILGTL